MGSSENLCAPVDAAADQLEACGCPPARPASSRPLTPIDHKHAGALSDLAAMRGGCDGDSGGCATLEALAHCIRHQLAVPDWLAGSFLRRLAVVKECRALSWDDSEAFGRYWPAGTRQTTEQRNIDLRKRVHAAAWSLLQADPCRSITRALFDEVGRMPGIHLSGGATERRYYEALRDGLWSLATLHAP